MKNICIKVIALLLALLCLVPTLVSCIGSEDKNDETTTTTPEENEPVRDTATLLADNKYAAEGLEYTLAIIDKYYDTRAHIVKRSLSQTYAAEIWYTGSFVEMLTEAYKLYPDNKTIKSTYIDVLNYALPQYEVKNAAIKTPTETHRGVFYYNAGKNSSGDFYFDDNAWICWQFFEAYELLGEEEYLKKAEDILAFLWEVGLKESGGIYWSKDFGGIGTCATAPTICCLLKAYNITNKQEYLDNAKVLYDFCTSTLMNKGSGIYYAGINDPFQPSYDQGTMILSGAMLYEITGEEQYYKDAKKTATSCLSHCFKIEGSRKDYTVKINQNPYYCSWAFAWLIRGVSKYIEVSDKKNETFMDYTKSALDAGLEIKNKKTGLYDHYFGNDSDDWIGRMFGSNDVVLLPTGYASMLLVVGYFDVHISEDILKAE